MLCGDALNQLQTLPDASVECCVTSPPYGKLIRYQEVTTGIDPAHYVEWVLPIVQQVARILVPGGVLALNLNGQGAFTYPEAVVVAVAEQTCLNLHERVAWVKANAVPVGHRDSHLIPTWEPIWVFRKGPHLAYFGRDAIRRPYSAATLRSVARKRVVRAHWGNHNDQANPYRRQDKVEFASPLGRDAGNVIWAAPEQSSRWKHPARFPTAIPRFFIEAYCRPEGTVLDPFAGSGTTLVTATALGRSAIGIELNPAYVAMIHKRFATTYGVFWEQLQDPADLS